MTTSQQRDDPEELRPLTTRVPRTVYDRLRLAVVLQDESIQQIVTAALDAHLPSAQMLEEARDRHRGLSQANPTNPAGEPGEGR